MRVATCFCIPADRDYHRGMTTSFTRNAVALVFAGAIVFSAAWSGIASAAEAPCATLQATSIPTEPGITGVSDQAKLLTIRLEADCDASATVRSITLVYQGGGESKKVKGLTAMLKDGAVVTYSATIDAASMTATLKFRTPLVIAAHTKADLTIVGTFDTSNGFGYHSVILELPTDIVSDNSEVTGSFPLTGPMVIVPGSSVRSCFAATIGLKGQAERMKARRACRTSR